MGNHLGLRPDANHRAPAPGHPRSVVEMLPCPTRREMRAGNIQLAALLLTSTLLVGCDAPGEGRRGEQAKHEGDKIVRGLDAYYDAKGRYPRELNEIDKRLLDVSESEEMKVFYQSSSVERYELIIKYFGPGSNICAHRSDMGEGEWDCIGAY